MAFKKKLSLRFIILFFILFCKQAISEQCEKEKELYIIRSTVSGLVLDGSDRNQVRVEHFTGYKQQLWRFERASKAGLFHIINEYTGTLLAWVQQDKHHGLLVLNKNSNPPQEWFVNSNGRITNLQTHWNVDVKDKHYVPGNPVGLYKQDGDKAQEFELQLRAVVLKDSQLSSNQNLSLKDL